MPKKGGGMWNWPNGWNGMFFYGKVKLNIQLKINGIFYLAIQMENNWLMLQWIFLTSMPKKKKPAGRKK